jgi:hypothetical protein
VSNRTLFIIMAFVAIIFLAGCVDLRAEQRKSCEATSGRYVVMDEVDDDICIQRNGDVTSYDYD